MFALHCNFCYPKKIYGWRVEDHCMSSFLENGLSDTVFRSIIQDLNYAVVIADIKGYVIYLNDAAELLFGYSETELIGKYVHDIFPTYDLRGKADSAFRKFEETGEGDLLGSFMHATALHKNGLTIDVQFTINTVEVGDISFIFSMIQDITHIIDMRNRNDLLETLATTDELTRILNRRAFFWQAKSAFNSAMRHKDCFSLLMIDLDYFKDINDQYGHNAGDKALQIFAKIVSNMIRGEDIFGRIGGEEFCIAMVKTGKEVALSKAERIREKIASSEISYEDFSFSLTISIGFAIMNEEEDTLEHTIKRADDALYEAKKTGRNKVVINSLSE